MQPIVTLLTDFGLMDPFVAEMKGVILSICPDANVVDISHLVRKYDVRMGAFLLAGAAPRFPHGTIHVAVVDPGVGSERRPIVIETNRNLFVGPDNGLMVPAADVDGILHVYRLTNRSLMLDKVSSTFHGRDVFAPTAAHLANGAPPKECGPEISDYAKPEFMRYSISASTAICEVFHVDSFGNVITNLPEAAVSMLNLKLGERIRVAVGGRRISARFVRGYSDLSRDEMGALMASHGFLEIACRESSAARRIRARTGSVVRVYVD